VRRLTVKLPDMGLDGLVKETETPSTNALM